MPAQANVMQASEKTRYDVFPNHNFQISNLGSFYELNFYFPFFEGRSFQSSQLALEVSHTGPCKSPCPGMESLGQFQAFGVRATNFGELFYKID